MSLEKEHEKQPTVTEIAPIGYGNPESTISYDKQIASGELSQEVDTFAGELLVPVANKDDGCIDGRPTKSLLVAGTEKVADNHNHERAKVAGGGYITATAMRLGVGVKGETIDADILETGAVLTSSEMFCGAHTGAHKHDDGTDCGANDRMLEIINNASQFEKQVEGTTKALLEVAGLEFKPETFKQVISNWQAVAADNGYFEGSTGVSRLEAAQAVVQTAEEQKQSGEPLGVVKHLAGSHKEDYLVVNYVEGKTVSQVALKDALAEKFPEVPSENLAQSFVVDAWRIVELAKGSVEGDDVEAAIYAGVMYQVATAATLTDGTLRTFIYS